MKGVVAASAASSVGLAAEEVAKQLPPTPQVTAAAPAGDSIGTQVANVTHLWVSMGSLYLLDTGIKKIFAQVGRFISEPQVWVG